MKLGVVHGARLADPHGLLEGYGKQHRYVAFSKPADLEKAGLKELLRTAVSAWKMRSEPNAGSK